MVIVVAIVVWNVFNTTAPQDIEIDFSRHLEDVRGGQFFCPRDVDSRPNCDAILVKLQANQDFDKGLPP